MTDTVTPPRRLIVTERDLHMLRSLSEARYLTAQAIEWLHVPGWRQRWQAWRAAMDADPTHARPYCPSSNVYSRLRRLEAAKLILRIYRPITLAVSTHKRDADLYALAAGGAEILAEYGGLDRDQIQYQDKRLSSILTLTHSGEIGRLYAALRAKIETAPGLQLADWHGDHRLATAYDRVEVPVKQAGGGVKTEALPVQPDGTFRLLHPGGELRCFVEVDRGRPVKTWRDKLLAYRRYAGSPELRARYDVTNFVLLCVTTTNTQRAKLMQATAQVLEKGSDYYLFGLLDDVHPMSIGGAWLKIAGVTTEGTQTRIKAAPHVFIH